MIAGRDHWYLLYTGTAKADQALVQRVGLAESDDLDPALEDAARQWNKLMPAQPITLRTRAEVAALTAGLGVEPQP